MKNKWLLNSLQILITEDYLAVSWKKLNINTGPGDFLYGRYLPLSSSSLFSSNCACVKKRQETVRSVRPPFFVFLNFFVSSSFQKPTERRYSATLVSFFYIKTETTRIHSGVNINYLLNKLTKIFLYLPINSLIIKSCIIIIF